MTIPKEPKGVVLFAHGSGSGRFSPRNQFVAKELNKAGFATLLIDLLTKDEESEDVFTGQFRFNIELLTERLISATHWIRQDKLTEKFNIGYFGASTGAAAALDSAAKLKDYIHAVVSRGGRPDLAEPWLSHVKAPTLLIVGGRDLPVIGINEEALKKLNIEKKLIIVPDAGHLFEEPGALGKVAKHAADWFLKYL